MFISVQSAIFFILLVLSPTDGNPVSDKSFASGFSGEIDSTENDYNRLKNVNFPNEIFRLGSMSGEKDDVADEMARLLRENRLVELPERSLAKLAQVEETGNFPPNSILDGESSNGASQKRNLKFNPTGWRKKRSADDLDELRNILEKAIEEQESKDGVPERLITPGLTPSQRLDLSKSLAIVRRSMRRSRPNPRLDAIIAHLKSLLAKRKGGPLDFNPTGW